MVNRNYGGNKQIQASCTVRIIMPSTLHLVMQDLLAAESEQNNAENWFPINVLCMWFLAVSGWRYVS